MTEHGVDALVIGGGPAGATIALLLARGGWSVALVERKDFPRRKVCGEYVSATNLPLLDRLGIGRAFRQAAGPPVQRVGLFAGNAILCSALPQPVHTEWGRALSRERLDTLLLETAREAGTEIFQPSSVVSVTREAGGFRSQIKSARRDELREIRARIVVAAHGSWEPGSLPTQASRQPPMPADLLGFKAHFLASDLAPGLMPLLAFPGGYGGMVHCDAGRVSLSCCIRRDQLALVRSSSGGDAGEDVLAHVRRSCLGVDIALRRARRDGAWLAAGPIRPGVRVGEGEGIFLVGNAAGEAHPLIAEGISMAIQSACLLGKHLSGLRENGFAAPEIREAGRQYAADWRRCFASRVYLSQGLAQWAMRSGAVAAAVPILRCFPRILSWFAHLSGKANMMVSGKVGMGERAGREVRLKTSLARRANGAERAKMVSSEAST